MSETPQEKKEYSPTIEARGLSDFEVQKLDRICEVFADFVYKKWVEYMLENETENAKMNI